MSQPSRRRRPNTSVPGGRSWSWSTSSEAWRAGRAGRRATWTSACLFQDAPKPGISGPAARIEDELEHRLGRPVQAIVMNAAPADLVHRILRDGRLVHETDRSARVRFEVAVRREYLDLLPILRRYRRSGAGAA